MRVPLTLNLMITAVVISMNSVPPADAFDKRIFFFLQKIIANTTAIEETVIGYTRLVDAMLTTTMCPTLLQVAPNS